VTSPVAALLWTVGALFAIALGAIPLRTGRGTPVVYGATALVSVLALGIAAAALLSVGAAPSAIVLPLGLPWLGAHFRLDALSAALLVLVNLGGAAAALYGIGYGRHESAPGRVLPFFPAFLAGMNLVVLADDAFTFLWSWEVMSLASWALVMADHRNAESRRAATIYLIMTVFGTMMLLLGFGLLAGAAGSYAFDAMRAASRAPWLATPVLLLALIGTGSKAGLVPLHVWLPLAHPAAPSHVSALMSGVMTKVAIYGFIRIVFDLLGTPPWWSGVLVLAIGGLTAVIGILSALMETDLKRALASSTIENVGIVFIGLGLALAFGANGLGAAAALAFTAALFHMLNHTLFKSLLFMGAGAVLTATGTRDMDRLGGLIHRLPATSALFLVGAAAISALPPLNGFASEWLAFQAVLLSPDLPQWALRLEVPAIGGTLALAAALAGAAFVRIFGIVFLGRPRSAEAAEAREVDRFMQAAMGILAALCLLAGIFPGLVVDVLQPAARLVTGAALPNQAGIAWLSLVPVSPSRSSYNGLLVLVFAAISAGLAAWFIHRFASHAVRRAIAWGCGFAGPTPATQYTAESFAQPLRRVFGSLVFRARETVLMPQPGDRAPARFEVRLIDPAWAAIYTPLTRAVSFAADRLNPLQYLTIRRYLAVVFVLLVLLLLAVAIWR
jgi:formate hydrogenlyase subunit 3/multisubunit Na+/H+ antiporter MnhD subunit